MRIFHKAGRVAAVRPTLAAMALLSSAASAQADNGAVTCDPNLKPAQETEAQREQRIFCETHAGCQMVMSVFRTTCRASEFFQKLTQRTNPTRPITNEDVAEAATPSYPKSAAADEAVSDARAASRSSRKFPMVQQNFESADGSRWYVESRKAVSDPHRYQAGTIVRSDGTIVRGMYSPLVRDGYVIDGGRLKPDEDPYREVWDAQAIMPDGQMKAGRNLVGTRLGGPGVTTYVEPDGRTSILEGTFANDRPYDEMVRRYSDGRSRREFYKDGVLQIVGEMSAPNGVPPSLKRPDVPAPAYNISMREGLYIQTDGPYRERYLLACNRQVIAVGDFGSKDKAPLPQPSTCPNPETYRNGSLVVIGPKYQGRTEYWCRGKMIAATPWARFPPQKYIDPEPRCEEPERAEAEEQDGSGGNIVENTLERGTFRPTGRVPNPLVVQGPPWPCASEIDLYMQEWLRRTGGGYKTPDAYWREFSYSPVRILWNSGERMMFEAHQQYVARVPAAQSQPIVWTVNGYPYREGFFRNAQSMRALSAAYANTQIYVGGAEGPMLACIAGYLADNARD